MPINVLIVEPNSLVRETVSQMVSLSGCLPIAVCDYPQAIGALSSIKVELLITGIGEDNDHVFSLANQAKKMQPSIKIVTSTRFKNLGFAEASAFVSVPFSPSDLRMAIQRALG